MAQIPEFDVVILGGGPAGCATALALRHRGVARVLLVEAGDYHAVRIGESLPPDTSLLLQELGLWQEFLGEGHLPCLGSCSAWGSDRPGFNDFLANPHGHGWHLDRRRFDGFLARKAGESGVEVRTGTRFHSARAAGTGFELSLPDRGGTAATVFARFVVDATGPAARFARQMGARRRADDRLTCVCGYFDLPKGAEFPRLTMVEAFEHGWWYAARLPGDRVVAVLASDSETVRQQSLHRPAAWLAQLRSTAHLERYVGGTPWGTLTVRNTPSFLLERAAGQGWLAVGDAATSFDPICSQGIHKALAGGIEAGAAIAGALRGDFVQLATYGDLVGATFADYQRNRDYLYGLEQRWPDSPFWQRRLRIARYPASLIKDF